MVNYIVTFFILAVAASFLGFGGLAADFAGSLVYSLISGRKPKTLI
jgi:uncharacterized membrane protein YtjA (UPF0391 family)